MEKLLFDRYSVIVEHALRLVAAHVEPSDLTGVIDFAAIYAQSLEEHDEVTAQLKTLGSVAYSSPTGDYYLLEQPLSIGEHTIKHVRIRRPDVNHLEMGYCDFEVVDFQRFRSKYLPKDQFRILENPDVGMIGLHDPSFPVRAFFLDETFE